MRNLSRLASMFRSYFGAAGTNKLIHNREKLKFNYRSHNNKILYGGILSYFGISGDNQVKDDPITVTVKSAILSIQVELVNILLLEHHHHHHHHHLER